MKEKHRYYCDECRVHRELEYPHCNICGGRCTKATDPLDTCSECGSKLVEVKLSAWEVSEQGSK